MRSLRVGYHVRIVQNTTTVCWSTPPDRLFCMNMKTSEENSYSKGRFVCSCTNSIHGKKTTVVVLWAFFFLAVASKLRIDIHEKTNIKSYGSTGVC